jgi:NAD(P)-dependent dehydrogenase (short-subunit alcohol dehydrogenase family)
MVSAAVEAFGSVHVLVNNAGLGWAAPATRETPEQFRKVIDINLNGQYWMAQAFGRAATEGGAIVNISSVLGLRPGAIPQAAYAASKAGLIGLTRDLAAQWTGRKGIRVNAVAPGYFPSEMTDEMAEGTAEMVAMVTPAGRLGEPHEIGDACVFLASDASSYITGITLPVDGGMVMP